MNKVKISMYMREVPRAVVILALKFSAKSQYNTGSSIYAFPSLKRVPNAQIDWSCPVGTIRISDHWNYVNSKDELVFRTDAFLLSNQWYIAINTGTEKEPWKIIYDVTQYGVNQVRIREAMKLIAEIRRKNEVVSL